MVVLHEVDRLLAQGTKGALEAYRKHQQLGRVADFISAQREALRSQYRAAVGVDGSLRVDEGDPVDKEEETP